VVAQNPDNDDAKKVKVKDTGGTGANLRDKPGQTGAVVKTIPEGAVLEVVGEDRSMDGKSWKNVKDDEGTVGWMASELLDPA
jgi:SH3-like domain-containing protein